MRTQPRWPTAQTRSGATTCTTTARPPFPRPDNRVTTDQDGKVHLSYTSTNDTEAEKIAGVAHQAGTCRFGADPATSVLDVNCKAHEVDNLYVTDTSFFPSIGAVNPALTAIANGIRVGEHVTQRLG